MEPYVWENMQETKKNFARNLLIAENGCWQWKRSLNWKNTKRYDSFYHRGCKRRVNIVAYELYNDVVLPNSYKGRSACGTPNCIHPHHTALYQNGSRFPHPPLVPALFQQGVPDRPELADEQALQLVV
jgi:hypothetical protein